MTVLLDTDVLVAFIDRRDGRHQAGTRTLQEVFAGRWGAPLITDYVIDEALTLLMARGAPSRVAASLIEFLTKHRDNETTKRLLWRRVDERVFAEAIPLFMRHYSRGLSFTDCTTLAMIANHRVGFVASFDHGFDGLVARTEA